MTARYTRRVGSLDEDAILAAFSREGLTPHGWSNPPGDAYAVHSHSYEKLLFCLRGSIIFRLPATDESIELHPGDRLEIDAAAEHEALVGANGVTCIEAARTAGRR